MKEFNVRQFDRASEILGNIAVAWFSAGVISPLFTKPKSLLEIVLFLSIGLVMTVLFAGSALYVVRDVKS